VTTATSNTAPGTGPAGGKPVRQTDYDPMTTPYGVNENDFPWGGPADEQAAFLLRYAILAPSTHNTQPWKFALVPGGIEVFADYSRRMPVVDPGNRELLMSVGAAIFTLRVAAEWFGMECRVTYSHSGDSERPLAVASIARREPPAQGDEAIASLFGPIVRRHTNRHPFLYSRVPRRFCAGYGGSRSGAGVGGRLHRRQRQQSGQRACRRRRPDAACRSPVQERAG